MYIYTHTPHTSYIHIYAHICTHTPHIHIPHIHAKLKGWWWGSYIWASRAEFLSLNTLNTGTRPFLLGICRGLARCTAAPDLYPLDACTPTPANYDNQKWVLYQLSHQGSPRVLEWVANPFSRGSSWLRNWSRVSRIEGGFFTSWATGEAEKATPGAAKISTSAENCSPNRWLVTFHV